MQTESVSSAKFRAPQSSGFDPKWAVERALYILQNPKTCWTTLRSEQKSVSQLYTEYGLILGGIASICGFIGMMVFGITIPFVGSYTPPFFSTLVSTVVQFASMLAMIFALAFVAQKFATSFSGNATLEDSLKLILYAMTANFAGGMLGLLPFLWPLAAIFAFYALYTFWQGVTPMTGVPADQKLKFSLAVFVSGIVIGLVLAAVTAVFQPRAPVMDGEAMKNLQDVSKSLEQFQKMAPRN